MKLFTNFLRIRYQYSFLELSQVVWLKRVLSPQSREIYFAKMWCLRPQNEILDRIIEFSQFFHFADLDRLFEKYHLFYSNSVISLIINALLTVLFWLICHSVEKARRSMKECLHKKPQRSNVKKLSKIESVIVRRFALKIGSDSGKHFFLSYSKS